MKIFRGGNCFLGSGNRIQLRLRFPKIEIPVTDKLPVSGQEKISGDTMDPTENRGDPPAFSSDTACF